ncbi:hypothetical protein [Paenibacillus sp. UMB4589-SE434]|uniref:hypothetical protein n=1 Tax=Paenibacillus sp. UMB4589-SE434 TaxID=3046314 RepID=UPI00254A46DC|nr:hypothetical protein [Paenibacillus sp. UMB4589-SE434]MDK8184040.1 hypothetical protein [Paenibacillus sp. UMB4589-SE434]
MNPNIKLSQHTAILLERARRFNITDAVLLACITTGDTVPLQVAAAQYYSYDEFVTYARVHHERLEDAVRYGYQMKFNTPGGVQLWLQERFGLEPKVDFEVFTGRLEQVRLNNEQLRLLGATLADNWVIIEQGNLVDRELLKSDSSDADIRSAAAGELRTLTLVIRSELAAVYQK